MRSSLAERMVPDDLWELVAPLLPVFGRRRQGGGRAPVSDRAVFAAIVYVLTTGCAWRHLPEEFGVSVPTAHRRFQAWTRGGVWARIHRAVLDEPGSAGLVDWGWVIVDAACLRAKRGLADRSEPESTGARGGRRSTS